MDEATIKSVMAELGSRGGKASAKRLTEAQRIERARKGGKAKASNVSKASDTIPKYIVPARFGAARFERAK